jgi:hypothetical protein
MVVIYFLFHRNIYIPHFYDFFMKDISKLFAVSALAIAAMFPIGCRLPEPPRPKISSGTINVKITNAPLNYSLNVFANDIPTAGINPGKTSCSFNKSSGDYEIRASGLEYIGQSPIYHHSDTQDVHVQNGNTYNISLTMQD